jgi:hypothetical protein
MGQGSTDALAPFVTLLAERIGAIVAGQAAEAAEATAPWLDAKGAADYLVTTEKGVRGLVLRRQIPFHKTPAGRILFHRPELDAWIRGDYQLDA